MIARKTLLIVLNNIIGGLLGFISLYFITNKMGAQDLGILGFGLSFVGIFTFLSNLGFDSAHNKRISEGRNLGKCIGVFAKIKVKLTVLMAVVSLVAIIIYGYGFGHFNGENGETQAKVTFIFLIYYVLWSLSLIAIATFNALKKQAMAQIPSILEFFVRSPLIILIALTVADIIYVAFVYVIGISGLLLLSVYFLRTLPSSKPDKELKDSYVSFAKPMAVISFTTSFSLYLDKVMISGLAGNKELGIYFACQQLVRFMITLAAPLSVLLFPTISQFHSQGKIQDIRNMLANAERYLSMMVFPAVALLAALSSPLISIFGEDYTDSAAMFTVIYLSFYSFFFILNKPLSQVMTGTGLPQLAMKISLAMLALNFLLNLLLIPEWGFMPSTFAGIGILHGAAGAAVATFLANGAKFVIVRKIAGKLVGYRMKYLTMIKFLASASTAAGFVYWLHNFVIMANSALIIIPEGLIGLTVYILVLTLLREFSKDDFNFFMDIFHPGKMLKYISGEISGEEETEE